MSRFYNTDPADPDAPVMVDEYHGLRPGMTVRYVGPMSLPGTFVVTELLRWDDERPWYTAVLDDGAYAVEADNLAAEP